MRLLPPQPNNEHEQVPLEGKFFSSQKSCFQKDTSIFIKTVHQHDKVCEISPHAQTNQSQKAASGNIGGVAERTVRESSTESTTKSLFLDRKTCETDVSGAILQSQIESSYLHAESNP
jgi:hypothetical protein